MADLSMTASTIAARLASGDLKAASVSEIQTLLGTTIETFVGSFTRAGDAATATGVGYTGVGFQPIGLFVIMANNTSVVEGSVGFSDGSTDYCIEVGTGTVFALANIVSFNDAYAFTDLQRAVVASFDSDGFTLDWTKTGSPGAQTLECRYIAIGDWP